MTDEIIYFIASIIGISSFFLTNILFLRLVYLLSSILFVTAGVIYQIKIMVIMNSGYVLVNSVQVIRLLIAKTSIFIPKEFQSIYKNLFSSFQKRDFLKLMKLGTVKHCKKDEVICRKGSVKDVLMLVLSGKFNVLQDGKKIAVLDNEFCFLGEMHFLTSQPMSADVVASTDVEYIEWNSHVLQNLKNKRPDLYILFLNVLSVDLIKKIQMRNQDELAKNLHEL